MSEWKSFSGNIHVHEGQFHMPEKTSHMTLNYAWKSPHVRGLWAAITLI